MAQEADLGTPWRLFLEGTCERWLSERYLLHCKYYAVPLAIISDVQR
jgi:hypothetical protein